MGNLYGVLSDRVEANARRSVAAKVREVDEYRSTRSDQGVHAALFDVAVLLRRRTIALAADGQPFARDDLGYIAAVGLERGKQGLSLASQQRVLALHLDLTLQEVREASERGGNEDLLRMLTWLGSQVAAAHEASMRGFMKGQQLHLPFVARVRLLTARLLAGDPAADALGQSLAMPTADCYAVAIVRVAGRTGGAEGAGDASPRDELVGALLKRWSTPIGWHQADELVVLAPSNKASHLEASTKDRILTVACDLAGMTGEPVAVGAAVGPRGALGPALDLARNVSRTAPLHAAPSHVHTFADVFVELGVADVPHLDGWLRDLARRLANGPDLAATLGAYYRNDMKRVLTAASLHIHPRTLDYRLQRVRVLTGLDPGSTHGVRTLSAAVTRILAGAWT